MSRDYFSVRAFRPSQFSPCRDTHPGAGEVSKKKCQAAMEHEKRIQALTAKYSGVDLTKPNED